MLGVFAAFIVYLADESVPTELGYGVNASQKCVPGLQLAPLDFGVLLLQRNVGSDIHGGITSYPVVVTSRKHNGIDVQIIQHCGNGDLGMEFFKYKNRMTGIGIKLGYAPGCVIGNAADVFHGVLFENAPGLAGTAITIEIVNFYIPEDLPKRCIANILTELIDIPPSECITGIQG